MARLTAERRRASLLEAALADFAERGFYSASMDTVAKRAEVSKPVVYDHFASKQALYCAVLDQQAAVLAAAIAKHSDPASEPLEERLRNMAGELCRFVRINPAASRLLFIDRVADAEVAKTHRRLEEGAIRLAADITASDADFSAPPGISRRRAALVLGQLQHACFVRLAVSASEQPTVPIPDLVAIFMDLLWVGLEGLRTGKHWKS